MTKRLVTQPTAAPVRKVKYAAVWGGAVAIAIPILSIYWPDAQGCIEGARVALEPFLPYAAAIIAGWFTRERDDPATART